MHRLLVRLSWFCVVLLHITSKVPLTLSEIPWETELSILAGKQNLTIPSLLRPRRTTLSPTGTTLSPRRTTLSPTGDNSVPSVDRVVIWPAFKLVGFQQLIENSGRTTSMNSGIPHAFRQGLRVVTET